MYIRRKNEAADSLKETRKRRAVWSGTSKKLPSVAIEVRCVDTQVCYVFVEVNCSISLQLGYLLFQLSPARWFSVKKTNWIRSSRCGSFPSCVSC